MNLILTVCGNLKTIDVSVLDSNTCKEHVYALYHTKTVTNIEACAAFKALLQTMIYTKCQLHFIKG